MLLRKKVIIDGDVRLIKALLFSLEHDDKLS